jgi:uncharacterized protein (TIGR02996 family)
MTLGDFLQSMIADPLSAPATWLVVADWLEDQGDPRAELVRLMYQPDYRRDLPAEQRDDLVRELLASGVGPVAPTLVNSIGMKLVLIPAGTFFMGSLVGEEDTESDEYPRHEVEITRPFFLAACPVTQEQFEQVTGKNPSHFSRSGDGKNSVKKRSTKQFPVDTVPWEEAAAFCAAMSKLPAEQQAGHTYRLPTEAEWEYACRGGAIRHSPFHFGHSLSSNQGNFDGNYPHGGSAEGPYLNRPSPVGSYSTNAFGLFDMHGNVYEWCVDWYDAGYYKKSPKRDPRGPKKGSSRVLRGGSWVSIADRCRSACRGEYAPDVLNNFIGFRVCCSPVVRLAQ